MKKEKKGKSCLRYLYYAAACMVAVVALVVYMLLSSFSGKKELKYVYIDLDDNVDSVYQKLDAVGSYHGMAAVWMLLRHTDYGENIHTGRFAINPDDSSVRIFHRLRNGQQAPIMLTIPESRTADLLASVLAKRLMVDSTTIVNRLRDSAFCASLGYTPQTIAAMLVPNTYEVYWDTDFEQLMKRLKREHNVFWNYERMHKAEAIGLTPVEVCTLASIIDEETANNTEKPMIAGMYLNRLKVGMPLQADPTVKFALGDFTIRRVRRGMLDTDSPYNTYRYNGLPPGPIKIASIKGIDAVLNRADHNYLYMCAKEDFSGTHNFAATYQEHQRNAARYAKALNERGIQ